jgi:SAM-dependent methyltransferase
MPVTGVNPRPASVIVDESVRTAAFSSRVGETTAYALTIFISAFLLFQVQPIIAKIILPWMGGAAAVWSVCLLFFQTVLLLGYLYAHLVRTRTAPRWQGPIHAALLGASLFLLPILPKNSWKPTGAEDPTLEVLLLLSVTVGLPYFLLSSTSPLLQAWYTQGREHATPYRFYALSNLGSMLALLSYPFLVEPKITRALQAKGWSFAYAGLVILCAAVALLLRRAALAPQTNEVALSPDRPTQLLWIALAACGSALLLAVTNHISQNIAAVPFLWIVPLSLYLLSFILCFEGHRWYHRGLFLRLLVIALGAMAYARIPGSTNIPFLVLIPLYCVGLFVCCMVCHGELSRLKPHPAHLTRFYLMCSLGGAIGALFVALIAPHIFSGYYELPVAMAGCAVLMLVLLYQDSESPFFAAKHKLPWLVLTALTVTLIATLGYGIFKEIAYRRVVVRNFYGMLRVSDLVLPDPDEGKASVLPTPERYYRQLLNGTIDHGMQLLDPARRREPTSYYARSSGIGLALQTAGKRGPLRVGVIGLGAGTLAAYGRAGDHYIFYDINPLVVRIAHEQFTFLQDSPARIDIEQGDARLSLEREPPQQFDVLAVDAFSSDSIPVHLLTREAFALYFRHVKPDGVLAVHISNRFLDLQPVVEAGAAAFTKEAVMIDNDAQKSEGVYSSTWVLIGNRDGVLADPAIIQGSEELTGATGLQLWTDDYSSLLRVLKK